MGEGKQTPQEEIQGLFRLIAAIVSTLPDSLRGCTFQALVAYQAARRFDLDVSIGVGGVLARVGPDPIRDVITLCDSQNMGSIGDDGTLFAHCWVRYRDSHFRRHRWRLAQPRRARSRAASGRCGAAADPVAGRMAELLVAASV